MNKILKLKKAYDSREKDDKAELGNPYLFMSERIKVLERELKIERTEKAHLKRMFLKLINRRII